MQPQTTSASQLDLYRKMNCRYCNTRLPESFLDLGVMPLANSFLTKKQAETEDEFTCPLRLAWCSHCRLVQLSDVVPPDRMFSNYLYVSSTTQTFKAHFAEYAQAAKAQLIYRKNPFLAVDIGSNDGLLLSCYQKEGMTAVGVEPAKNLSDEANRNKLPTLHDYFGSAAVQKIIKDYGRADIVSGNNVFAHMDDIQNVLRNVQTLLVPQGIFIIEFPYLLVMVEQMLFDMIYHEHLSYIALRPLQFVLKQFDLEIFRVEQVASHGGSLRVFIQKKNGGHPLSNEVETLLEAEDQKGYGSFSIYQDFARCVYQVKTDLIGFVQKVRSQGKTVSGYGAAAKGNTLINFCGFDSEQIDYMIDDNPLKQNLLTPGARIPVFSSKHLFEHPTDFVLLFAWNFAEEIIKKLAPLRSKGVQFIIPLPKPRIV